MLADASLDLPEEAWVLADTDPGPPEECAEDRTVLSGRSEKNPHQWHLTFDSFHFFPGGSSSRVGLTARDHSQHLGFYQLSGFQKGDAFFNTDVLNISFCQTGQSWANEVWGPLQLEHSLGPSHRPSCLSFPHHWHFSATLQRLLVWPNLLQLKHRIGFGTNKATFTFR